MLLLLLLLCCFKGAEEIVLKDREGTMVEAPMNPPPGRLAANYEALHSMRAMMETMKKNQAYRGEEGLKQRTAARAQRQTWRQMKGAQLMMHEINHPGNKPFVIGLG